LVQGGSQKNLGAALVLVLMTILAIGMLYYLWETQRQQEKLAA
jgi:preprotein translocase subunit YajC